MQITVIHENFYEPNSYVKGLLASENDELQECFQLCQKSTAFTL